MRRQGDLRQPRRERVILVETKKGAAEGGPSIAYDTYVAAASQPAT